MRRPRTRSARPWEHAHVEPASGDQDLRGVRSDAGIVHSNDDLGVGSEHKLDPPGAALHVASSVTMREQPRRRR
jgi:hypothetical protein